MTLISKSNFPGRELLAACFLVLCAPGVLLPQRKPEKLPPFRGQRENEKIQKALPPRWDSPPEVTILKHEFGASKKFVTEVVPDPSNSTGETTTLPGERRSSEPSSSLRKRINPAVYLKVKNQTPKKIVSMVWYFVLHKSAEEEYFRVRFVDTSAIEAGKTRTLTGEMDRIPRRPQTVSVDELSKPPSPAQERIVISCLMFEDGSFSSLNEFTKEDCENLKAIQNSKTK